VVDLVGGVHWWPGRLTGEPAALRAALPAAPRQAAAAAGEVAPRSSTACP